jgi:trehalose 6-phosphate phosphatase
MKMRILNLSDASCTPFWKRLHSARSLTLISDYDGTLAPFRKERMKAFPYEGVPELIDDILTRRSVRFVVVSGRPVSEVARLLGTRNMPEIWGAHGWERMYPDGACQQWRVNKKALSGLSKARKAAEERSLQQYCEVKTGAIALHWRGISQEEKREIKELVDFDLKSIAPDHELLLRPFDGGVELLATERNKGSAIEDIIGEMPPGGYPIYLGDDLTDEDGFRAVGSVGGYGILVNKKGRISQAHFQLIPPEGVINLLRLCLLMKEG